MQDAPTGRTVTHEEWSVTSRNGRVRYVPVSSAIGDVPIVGRVAVCEDDGTLTITVGTPSPDVTVSYTPLRRVAREVAASIWPGVEMMWVWSRNMPPPAKPVTPAAHRYETFGRRTSY